MQRHRGVTLERLEKFAHPLYWRDVNLRGNHYTKKISFNSLKAFAVPDLKRITFAEAMKGEYHNANIGQARELRLTRRIMRKHLSCGFTSNSSFTKFVHAYRKARSLTPHQTFGPTWATVWWCIEAQIPSDWKGEEVHLLWEAGCEGLVWSADGVPLQGLYGGNDGDRRAEYRIAAHAKGGEKILLYLEMACNEMFGAGAGMQIAPPDPNKRYTLAEAALGLFDREKWELYLDFTIISDMAKLLPQTSSRSGQALWTANEMVNTINIADRKTWAHARELAAKFLSERTAESEHTVAAIGHCHIDTAWLWPYAETLRKCARSWATQIHYMSMYPTYVFAASQAQQYAWMKEHYPSLWTSIKKAVASNRFIPTGGTWIEMDCNVPSGESLVRQFLYGQRFFEQEFGHRCTEFWLPDTFGYSAQLPQIVHSAGIEFFLTQKLSWNLFNKPTMHSFLWEGLDGTRLFTHFPPADTYNAEADVNDVLKSAANYNEKDRSKISMTLYGKGDGGGGPLPEQIHRLTRMHDVAGMPRVKMQTPVEAFKALRADMKEPLVWVGELYFELHRGTYTTQAAAKKGNRRGEDMLREAEVWSALAHVHGKGNFKYPSDELQRLWRLLLLNQFHDVLPGSSIGAVYDDCAAHHADILQSATALARAAASSLAPNGAVFNSLAFARQELLELDSVSVFPDLSAPLQTSHCGKVMYMQALPSLGFCAVAPTEPKNKAEIHETKEGFVLQNEALTALITRDGLLRSLVHRHSGRESIAQGGAANQFVLFDDVPFYWDAWDVEVYHLEKRYNLPAAASVTIVESGPLRVMLQIKHTSPPITSLVSLAAHGKRLEFDVEVDWQEKHKFLKVEFPLHVRCTEATYEVQYGHVRRPTHRNTSWDLARFEVCAHRWADLSEHNFGVALLNDCKYGYATLGNTIRLSLLRSPKNPDPRADMGVHRMRYALVPHSGSLQDGGVLDEAASFNVPPLTVPPTVNASATHIAKLMPCFWLPQCGVVLDVVKAAEDRSGDYILRLYESWGGTATFSVSTSLAVQRAASCSILEEEDCAFVCKETKHTIGPVSLGPFKFVTLRVKLASA